FLSPFCARASNAKTSAARTSIDDIFFIGTIIRFTHSNKYDTSVVIPVDHKVTCVFWRASETVVPQTSILAVQATFHVNRVFFRYICAYNSSPMKWTFIIQQKFKVILLLTSMIVLIGFTNYLEQRNIDQMDESFN